MKKGVLLLLCQLLTLTTWAQDLRSGFLNPPQEARPRVWVVHWMNGNITRDGIRKDIEWMHRAGIGGFHCFDAGMGMKPVVEQRLDYMSGPWKEAFRLAVRWPTHWAWRSGCGELSRMEQYRRPVGALRAGDEKRLVWTETIVKGGRKQSVVLPMPKQDRWYDDISVLAVRIPDNDKTLEEMGGQITISRESDEKNGPCTILCTFPQPQTIKALSINDGRYRSIWAALAGTGRQILGSQRRWHVVPAACARFLHGSISGRPSTFRQPRHAISAWSSRMPHRRPN